MQMPVTNHIGNTYPLHEPFFTKHVSTNSIKEYMIKIHNKAICINHDTTRNICSVSGVMIIDHVYLCLVILLM